MKDIKHVQLEAGAFISDVDFQLMDAEQRGVYCSIIFFLYANGGIIVLDNKDITLLYAVKNRQNVLSWVSGQKPDNTVITLLNKCGNVLGRISNCSKSGLEWLSLWLKIGHKFKINGNILTHKRVTEELKRASDFRKMKSEAGKKGMKKRWADNTVITKESKVKESKVKEVINIYKKEDFIDAGFRVGLTENDSVECYEHYKGQNFEFKKDYPIRDPVDACTRWRNNRHRFQSKQGSRRQSSEELKAEYEKLKANGEL